MGVAWRVSVVGRAWLVGCGGKRAQPTLEWAPAGNVCAKPPSAFPRRFCMSERFLLPCECGQSVVVERRQAGTSVSCRCGKSLDVPTIRGFAKLTPAAEQEQQPLPPIWGLRQGLIFLGLVTAIPAFVFAGFLYFSLPKLTQHYDLLEQEIEQLPPQHTWAIWKMYEQGMPKGPTPTSVAVRFGFARLSRNIVIAMIVGGLGLLIAAAGLLVNLGSKRGADHAKEFGTTADKPRR